jgi:putative peptide zinc metalloprotease protein
MNILDRLLMPQNLLLVWLIFPLIKTAHEFGHAFAVKAFGGQVHDMGVMLLVFTPVPYVDASSVSSFREKWQRVMVGAAGMVVELFIAALAFYVWLNAEPGTVRTMAYNAVLIAGISTIIFNANPLLRYDGYYILADLIEIPNLRTRANNYLGYLCEHHLFGNRDAETPRASASERRWFVAYGILSFVYRTFVVVAILFYVAERLFNIGALLAVLAALTWSAIPVVKGFHFLITSPRIRSVRSRAIAVTAAIVVLVLALLCLVPLPYRTLTEGVIWIPEESFVRAGTEGFVERIVATPGSRVRKGDVLVVLSDPVQSIHEQMLAAHVRELEARYNQHLFTDRVKADIVKEELRYAEDKLARARQQAADLTIKSRIDGVFVVPVAEDLPGRFVHQGEQIGHVLEFGTIAVRAIVSQATIELVRYRTRALQVRLSERMNETIPAVIQRMVPGASEKLPARALGSVGGGEIATDPTDRHGLTAVQKVFQIDLTLPLHTPLVNLGGHAYVRFDHGWAPLAVQWYRSVRQLFLSRLNV